MTNTHHKCIRWRTSMDLLMSTLDISIVVDETSAIRSQLRTFFRNDVLGELTLPRPKRVLALLIHFEHLASLAVQKAMAIHTAHISRHSGKRRSNHHVAVERLQEVYSSFCLNFSLLSGENYFLLSAAHLGDINDTFSCEDLLLRLAALCAFLAHDDPLSVDNGHQRLRAVISSFAPRQTALSPMSAVVLSVSSGRASTPISENDCSVDLTDEHSSLPFFSTPQDSVSFNEPPTPSTPPMDKPWRLIDSDSDEYPTTNVSTWRLHDSDSDIDELPLRRSRLL